MKDIAIFGAGGLGRELPFIIEKINQEDPTWNFIGYFDDGIGAGTFVDGFPVIGNFNILQKWEDELSIVIGIGNPNVVESIIGKLTNPNIDYPNLVSPDVYFYNKKSVKMGIGNVFNHNATVSINVQIGNFNTFGANTVLGHDSTVGDYNTMMVSSQICGHSVLNTHNFMGIGSIVLQGVHVDSNVTVGAGSIVMKDTVNDATYFGNPARPMMKK